LVLKLSLEENKKLPLSGWRLTMPSYPGAMV